MAYQVRRIDYFYITVHDSPEIGYEVLAELAELGVNLVAITAIPFGPVRTQLTVFPDDTARMRRAAEQANVVLDGPHPAVLVQGDDEVGALARIHRRLHDANVHVFASTGVADGQGRYGYVIYVRPEEADRAAEALID